MSAPLNEPCPAVRPRLGQLKGRTMLLCLRELLELVAESFADRSL